MRVLKPGSTRETITRWQGLIVGHAPSLVLRRLGIERTVCRSEA